MKITSTKAAILVQQHQPLVVAEISLPSKLEYGQVLVKVHSSGICGSQIGEIDGAKGPDAYLPHLLGHEAGAVVEQCGPGVKKVEQGDHVVLHWRKAEGAEGPTPQYRWGDKVVNAGWVTTFSEYAIVSENRLTPIPVDIELDVAALYGCAIPTGFGAVFNDARLCIGESIVIFGAGGVGLSSVMAAKMHSAYPIIAVDVHANKLDKALKLGASHVINSSQSSVEDAVRQLLPNGTDVCIDTTGIKSVMESAYQITSNRGRTVLVGVPTNSGETMAIDSLPLHFDKLLTGSHGGGIDPSYHLPRLLRLQQQQVFDPSVMISHSYTLDEINSAIDAMRRGEVIRCTIKM